MRHSIFLFALMLISAASMAQDPIRNYSYKFQITNLPDTIDSSVFIANYYGSKQYYFDTIALDKDGRFTMSGDSINGGIYSVIAQDRKSYFEFVVNEPNLSMVTKHGDFVNSMKVEGSVENIKFYEYLSYIEDKSKRAQSLKPKLEAAEGKEKEKIQDELKVIDGEVVAYKKDFISNNPDLFIAKVFQASADPDVDEYLDIKDEDERKLKRYNEFKRQYLEHVDFTDERLLRTPIFHNKFIYYLTKLTPQMADSVIVAADMLAEMARPNKEIFKYVVHTITSKYEDSKVMGMDAVMVHMGQTYYCNGDAWWLSEDKLEKFCERVDAMAPLLIGKKAPNLILPDTAGVWQNMYEITEPYTVLYFWDPNCGHCKKVTPKLIKFVEENKDKNVAVFAVGTEFEEKDWKKYIEKNKLPFINVSDNPEVNENAHELIGQGITTLESLNFRDTYDIFSTPKVYLLDIDKRIIAVKLMPEQLGEFIENHEKREKELEKRKDEKKGK